MAAGGGRHRTVIDDNTFRRRHNRRDHPTTQGRSYRGPNPTRGVLPKVKFDLTSDEVLTQRPTLRPIGHQCSDQPLPVRGVADYPITELFGEKLRALAERCGPRDLYDVVHLHRHPDLMGRASAVAAVLQRKCEHAGIDVPTLESIRDSRFRDEIEREWENMLGHQLPRPLPPFDSFWSTLDDVFGWLAGTRPSQDLPRAQLGNLDPDWTAPRAITTWRRGSRWNCSATPARTGSASRSTTAPNKVAPAPSRQTIRTQTHERRQHRPVRDQRPTPASQLPSRPHRRHQAHYPVIHGRSARRVLHPPRPPRRTLRATPQVTPRALRRDRLRLDPVRS